MFEMRFYSVFDGDRKDSVICIRDIQRTELVWGRKMDLGKHVEEAVVEGLGCLLSCTDK